MNKINATRNFLMATYFIKVRIFQVPAHTLFHKREIILCKVVDGKKKRLTYLCCTEVDLKERFIGRFCN